jgi:hypothetical protein
MDRRSFLLNASAYVLPIPTGNEMHFKVLRNGTAIGDHLISFNRSGDDLAISITASLLVKIAMIPVFRYALTATERWSNGVFQTLDSAVNFNGAPLEVHAERVADGYNVRGTHVPLYKAPANTLPLTYWNRAMINGTILNIQTAHSYPVKVSSPGWYNLPAANGGTITAQRFNLTGKLRISIWYDQNNSWSGLEFQKNGDISYQKYKS